MIGVTAIRHPHLPEHLQQYLTRVGGTNLFGGPNFRIVWAQDRLKWNGSPKYRQQYRQGRWIIEVYRPPLYYGDRKKWEQTYYTTEGKPIVHESKGPFPSRGDYEWLDTVEAIDAAGNRNYLMPTEAYLDTVVNLYHLIVSAPAHEVRDKLEAKDLAKREADVAYIYERIKERTDPLFRPAFAALNNTDALVGKSVPDIARTVEALHA